LGPRGVGKTHSIEHVVALLEKEEDERAQAGESPRRILHYEASAATGSKTALIDLLKVVTKRTLSIGARRAQTAMFLIDRAARALMERQIHLVCIDEAQMIDPANLDLLRQIPDRARKLGHAMGIIYIGSEELHDRLVRIQQLGQRIGTVINLPRIEQATLAPHLAGFHPDLGALKPTLPKRAWRSLEADLFRAVNGKWRRLNTILTNADEMSRFLDRPIDEAILRAAIEKLAAEA
jgi:type II secretory pathway predicted ATPase ExeA